MAFASMLTAATAAAAYNGTVKTVTVTSWSTVNFCPPPPTVTLCNAQCAISTSPTAADIIYQTSSVCKAGQVLTLSGAVTTFAQPTTLTFDKTISNVLLVPDSNGDKDYTAVLETGSVIHPSSMTANEGQVVTCQNGITTITGNEVVLTNCPCTAQTTTLEITATNAVAVPTAVAPSTNYVVQILYVYVVEYIVEQVPTAITATVTSTLTTVQTESEVVTNTLEVSQTDTATMTTTATTTTTTPRPTIVTSGGVTFLLEYDISYDGSASNSLRKRQAIAIPGVPADLSACLFQCAEQQSCVATLFDESTSSCSPLIRFNAQSRRNAPGQVFAITYNTVKCYVNELLATDKSLRFNSFIGVNDPFIIDQFGSADEFQ
ncbi:hypothetical protein E4T39_07655 [Aureobasidium subglaciale]|nr:hypothetical protein E4T39_07655 [Aureobasidium subglaciale]